MLVLNTTMLAEAAGDDGSLADHYDTHNVPDTE